MTTNQLLELDCREDENQRIVQKALKLIKPLKNEVGIVPIEKLERAIKVMCEKYDMWVRELCPDVQAGEKHIVWRSSIINVKNLKTIGVVYGCTLYEVVAKTTIFIYSETRKEK